ncbi:Hsp70 family protein [Actinoplanes bogorensis]|uniref:Hsp70 family protein n=1 Tax=Paractinoplanes bogorensis TaxID=1610840 RepID=A0ABS5YUN3_9ACTN|nr:Hsp70 family protein [Actinoplanes bogorensis]MBU2667164.1 Hsp70 family protein [Actinoplanes bogorensis]
MADEAVLVVDFGTSGSAGVLVAGDRTQPLREPSSGLFVWPSSVLADGEELLVGTLPDRKRLIRPGDYQNEIKRLLGRSDVTIGGRTLSPADLFGAVLRAFRDEAQRIHGRPIEQLLLTVPAAYHPGDPRRELMIGVAQGLGFGTVELLYEPVAAAGSAPAGEAFAPGDLVLVYDFGGGTFDAALVRVGADGHDVLRHAALDHLGGLDLDEVVYQHLAGLGGDELTRLLAATDRLGGKARIELAERARRMKEQLSDVSVAEDILGLLDLELRLDRDTFDKLAEPLVAQTVECCERLVAGDQPAWVLMVGGSSRVPLVASMMAARFGRVRASRDPELAVVTGAAAWAARGVSRVCPPQPQGPEEKPLRWAIPQGLGTLTRWLRSEGESYRPGDALAQVRLADGPVYQLTADEPGVVLTRHAEPGDLVAAGDWLVTVAPTFRPWETTVGSGVEVWSAADYVVVAGDGMLRGLAPSVGTQRWIRPVGGERSDCTRAGDVAVVCEPGGLRGIALTTGQDRWFQPYARKAGRLMPEPVFRDDNDIFRIDPATGEEIWRRSFTEAPRFQARVPASGTFVVTEQHQVHMVDLETGEVTGTWTGPRTYRELWNVQVIGSIVYGRFGYKRNVALNGRTGWPVWVRREATALTFSAYTVYPRHYVLAGVNPATGDVWQYYRSNSYQSVVRISDDAENVYLREGNELIAVNIADGRPRWRRAMPGNRPDGTATAVWLWPRGLDDLLAIDRATGQVAWVSAHRLVQELPGGVLATSSGHLEWLDPLTGAVHWSVEMTGETVKLLYHDDETIAVGADSGVFLMEAGTGAIRHRLPAGEHAYYAGRAGDAELVHIDSTLYAVAGSSSRSTAT